MKWLSFACVLWFFGLSMVLRGDEKPIAELAALKAQYEAKVKRDVFDLHQTNEANLLAKYRTAVSRALEAAQAGNKVEDVAALEAEKALVESGKAPPPLDDETPPKMLKSLRSTYRLESTHLDQERDQKWQPLRDEYARSLDSLVAKLGRDGKAEQALAVKLLTDRLRTPALKIMGEWDTEICGGTKAVWRFNKDFSWKNEEMAGKFSFKNSRYIASRLYNWEIRMIDDDTFEGVCTKERSAASFTRSGSSDGQDHRHCVPARVSLLTPFVPDLYPHLHDEQSREASWECAAQEPRFGRVYGHRPCWWQLQRPACIGQPAQSGALTHRTPKTLARSWSYFPFRKLKCFAGDQPTQDVGRDQIRTAQPHE